MLGHNAFYHNIIRKYIVAFGSLFNDIHVIRSDKDGNLVKDIKVPITFASKDKTRYELNNIHSNMNAQYNIGSILPRLSYTLSNSIEFDNLRPINPLHTRMGKIDPTSFEETEILMGRPFNFNFQLSVWTKYIDDMFQIIEQILCFFKPDYHVTIKEIPELNIESSIPIVYLSCSPNFETEFDDNSWRVLRFDIDFQLKGWIYPPIKDSAIINNIKMNFYSDLDDQKKISIVKNEYDDENSILYSAIVDNTDALFSSVDVGGSIVPIAQVQINVYKSDERPVLAADELTAYWFDTTSGNKYLIIKSKDEETLIPI